MLVNRNVTVPDGGRTDTLALYVKVTGRVLRTGTCATKGPQRSATETAPVRVRFAKGRPTP
jgi:hypothetical protein